MAPVCMRLLGVSILRVIALLLFCALGAGGILVVQPDPVSAQRAKRIQRVIVEGTNRIEARTVGTYLRLSVGDPFDASKIDDSIKSLYATGLFKDVSVRREGDNLVVRVVENPIINRIAYEGNKKIEDGDLAAEVPLRPRSVYTATRVQEAVRRMLQLYRRQGRFGATITPKIIQRTQNRVDLVFEINEGAVTGIRRISFIGNSNYSDSSLRGVISTKESAWWRFFGSSDVYDPDKLNFDKELLRRFYLSRGHAEFRVLSAVAELTSDRKGFFVTFTVVEGPRYRFGKSRVRVRLPNVPRKRFVRAISYREGQRYDAGKLERVINRMTDIAGAAGYAFARVRPLTRLDKKKKTVNITFDVREGPRVFVERIEIVGNLRTRDEVIRREVRIAEGDAFNTVRIRQSRRRLTNLGFFEKVTITNRRGSAPDKVIITVRVVEKATGELSLGAGFSTQDGVLGTVGLREKNFLGRGQDVNLTFTLSQRSNQLNFSFTEPYFLNRNLSFGIDAFRVDRSFQDESGFDQLDMGGALRFGFRITENFTQRIFLNFSDKEINDVNSTSPLILRDQGKSTRVIFGSELRYDTRNSRFDPTDGYVVSLTGEIAGLGGSERFARGLLRGAYHWSIFEGVTLSFIGEAGMVEGIGKRVRLEDRFYLGGNNFRGFAFAGVGPRDRITDDAVGANKYYVLSVELAFPIGLPKELGVRGRVFADFGSSFDVDVSGPTLFDQSSPRATIGVGISWRSPLGPIQIDLGFAILKNRLDDTQLVNFRFGTRF